MRQTFALVWLAVCGLMLHRADGLVIPDEFDNALAALSQDDVTLKQYVNDQVPRAAMEEVLDEAIYHRDVVRNLGVDKAHDGELALLKRVLVQAFDELIQEIRNALGLTLVFAKKKSSP